jgi:Raf kinase inhibitor-like YbhB/YbcL family protein
MKALFSMRFFLWIALLALLFTPGAKTFAGRSGHSDASVFIPESLLSEPGGTAMTFAISSSSFQNGGEIPKKFTCDGADVSPALSWANPPSGTKSFALIGDDPDAPVGTWTHWVLFDLPAHTTNLAEGVAKVDEVPGGGRQGRNDFRRIGYGGPCPPPGKPHRYFFKLYALDKMLDLKPGASKQEVERATEGHVLGKAEVMGAYRR